MCEERETKECEGCASEHVGSCRRGGWWSKGWIELETNMMCQTYMEIHSEAAVVLLDKFEATLSVTADFELLKLPVKEG